LLVAYGKTIAMGRNKKVPHIQYPSQGPIHYQNLIWTQNMRRGSKDFFICIVMTAYILWERINDFIKGLVMDNGFSVEWAKEDDKENKKELKRIKLTSSIVQTWYIILIFIFILPFSILLKEVYIYDFTTEIKTTTFYLGFIVLVKKKITDSILSIKKQCLAQFHVGQYLHIFILVRLSKS
jgi:hypothetical protein